MFWMKFVFSLPMHRLGHKVMKSGMWFDSRKQMMVLRTLKRVAGMLCISGRNIGIRSRTVSVLQNRKEMKTLIRYSWQRKVIFNWYKTRINLYFVVFGKHGRNNNWNRWNLFSVSNRRKMMDAIDKHGRLVRLQRRKKKNVKEVMPD